MPLVPVNGVRLHVVERGDGAPIVFLHEFAGNAASWQPQFRRLARRYRCIAYNSRGYPPSEVPEDESAYGQQIATDDLRGLLDAMGIARAHIVGLSMGAYTALMLAMQSPERVWGVVAASGGSGSAADPAKTEVFAQDSRARADRMLADWPAAVEGFANAPNRVQLARKDPKNHQRFLKDLENASAKGSAYTMRRVQGQRPSLYTMGDGLAAIAAPVLLVAGDEDEACLDVNLFLKRTMPTAGLVVMPKAGHLVNLEDPPAFNRHIESFLAQVEAGTWPVRGRA